MDIPRSAANPTPSPTEVRFEGGHGLGLVGELRAGDGVPVLLVGPQFYHLGGFDKRRVITTLDTVYGITESGEHPVIILKDWHTKREIGLFSKDGLQLE